MEFKGKVWKFGDHVDTDLIIPAKFLNVSDKTMLAGNCFADYRPDFAKNVQTGDISVAGVNFGCGSSREHAPLAIKGTGISVIIAASFSRIFYRNAINIGLPILESDKASKSLSEGATISVDLLSGEITDTGNGEIFYSKPIPGFMIEIMKAGGIVEYIKKHGRMKPA